MHATGLTKCNIFSYAYTILIAYSPLSLSLAPFQPQLHLGFDLYGFAFAFFSIVYTLPQLEMGFVGYI